MTPQDASAAAAKVCLLAPVVPVLVIDDASSAADLDTVREVVRVAGAGRLLFTNLEQGVTTAAGRQMACG
mgnify:CR=1 FL=1